MNATLRHKLMMHAQGMNPDDGSPLGYLVDPDTRRPIGAVRAYQMQEDALAMLHKLDREDVEDARAGAEAARALALDAEAKRKAEQDLAEFTRQARAREAQNKAELAQAHELKHRELDQRDKELQIEQAKVVVRMLEVASTHGGFSFDQALAALAATGIIPASHQIAAASSPSLPPVLVPLDTMEAED